MTIRIIMAGPRGQLGSESLQMIENEPNFELIACIDRINNGKKLNEVNGSLHLDVPIYENPEKCFQENEADVFLDLTIPDVGFEHTKIALKHQMRTVIGTSGFTNEQINELRDLANAKKIGCIIAPNFAIGAILMMQFAKKAAKYFKDVEIIEKHHDQKLDAPSGTAVKTIEMIKEIRESHKQGNPAEYETIEGSRGGEVDGIRIHSVRLPGLVAHQEVIIGGPGQTLTISHDSYNRKSFMEGIKIAINHVMELNELVYGLENILDM